MISARSEAQNCGNVNYTCSAHKLPWPAFTLYDMPHNDCRLCDGGYGDDFTLCHWECNQSFDDEDTRMIYIAVLAAAKVGNVREILDLTPKGGLDARVTYNRQRNAVQIVSCNGNLVASLPVRTVDLVVLAHALPGLRSDAIVVAMPSLSQLIAQLNASSVAIKARIGN